jgi:hypothetical protein
VIRARLVQAACAAMAAVIVWPHASGAAPPDVTESELLETYAPVVAMRQQTTDCGEGERFLPVAVDAIFGRDDVVLRADDGDIVVHAPTADDLASAEEDHWIDLPGNTLDPGCSYEQWFNSLDASPAVYGRVTSEHDSIVVQYWFFWVYNQWNDVHEGDWEMIQLIFDGPSPADALAEGPTTYAYAQHEGSEYAKVGDNDGKLVLEDGTHPVVFVAEGSHAAFFSSSRWFGKSGATGFGCDDTSGPVESIRPDVVPLPGDDIPTEGPLAWLSFRGRWGERAPAFNNGPTGPVTKSQWAAPVTWVDDEGRDEAVALPFTTSPATETFCNLAASGSALFNRLLDEPLLVSGLIALVVLLLVLIVRGSSRGALGRAARRWRTYRTQMLSVGALVVAGAAAAWAVQLFILSLTPLGTLVDAVGASSAWALPLAAIAASLVGVPVICWVIASTLAVRSGVTPVRRAFGVPTRQRSMLWTTLTLVVLVGLAPIAFPIALFLGGRWLVAPVVATQEGAGFRASLGESNRLTRGHTFRAMGLLLTIVLVIGAAGVAGALVLVLTSLSFTAAGLVTALAGVVIVPYVALVLAQFHDELDPASST